MTVLTVHVTFSELMLICDKCLIFGTSSVTLSSGTAILDFYQVIECKQEFACDILSLVLDITQMLAFELSPLSLHNHGTA